MVRGNTLHESFNLIRSIRQNLVKNIMFGGRSDNTVDCVLALHTADSSFILIS